MATMSLLACGIGLSAWTTAPTMRQLPPDESARMILHRGYSSRKSYQRLLAKNPGSSIGHSTSFSGTRSLHGRSSASTGDSDGSSSGASSLREESESQGQSDAAKSALARALAYKAKRSQNPASVQGGMTITEPTTSRYEAQMAEMQAALTADKASRTTQASPVEKSTSSNSSPRGEFVEVEIVTRDGVIKRRTPREEVSRAMERPVTQFGKASAAKKTASASGSSGIPGGGSSVSVTSSDFLGLGFQEEREKWRGKGSLPAGLQAPADMPSAGSLPAVEIITRDASLGKSKGGEEGEESYKPKVATWGVFERPRDISKTVSGARSVRGTAEHCSAVQCRAGQCSAVQSRAV